MDLSSAVTAQALLDQVQWSPTLFERDLHDVSSPPDLPAKLATEEFFAPLARNDRAFPTSQVSPTRCGGCCSISEGPSHVSLRLSVGGSVGSMLIEIDESERARAHRIIAAVGESEFRAAVGRMTAFDTDALTLDDVVSVYVMARHGRVRPRGAGHRAASIFPTLPPPTADDPCVERTRSPGASRTAVS